MEINQKLKVYKEIKEVCPEFLFANFARMSERQKIIYYNTLKDELTEDEQIILMNELDLDQTTIEELANKVEEFRYILVGNIIDKHYYGVNKEIRSGTKLFRAGAKVFLFPKYGGNGHMQIPVYGLPRKSRIKIHIVIRANMIKNVRVKKMFDPKLVKKIDESYFYDYFDNNEKELQNWADWLNENHVELMDEDEITGNELSSKN